MSKNLTLNKPQTTFVLNLPKLKGATWIAGRGTGKTYIIAWLVHMIVKHMPGSTWFILGPTFKQLLDNTLPPLFDFLEEFGYVRNIDYVIGHRPPANWILPRQAPVTNFDHYITFYNKNGCAGFYLVSQDKAASVPRGRSMDGGIRDEVLLIDDQEYIKTLRKTLRGNLEKYKHVPFHHGVFDFTSMPYTNETMYLTERGKYYEEDYNIDFEGLRAKQIDLQMEFIKTKNIKERVEIWEDLRQLDRYINYKPSKANHLYMESSVFDNIKNVGIDYIEREYDNGASPLIFMIEMLSFKPKSIEGGFYTNFSRDKHTYKGQYDYSYLDSLDYDFQKIAASGARGDADYLPLLPLEIGVDWGANINCLVTGQHLKSINTINIIKDFYVKNNTFKPMFIEWCKYYSGHSHKVVNFHYDPQGNKRQANSNTTFAEDAAEIMKSYGWTVKMISLGGAYTRHKDKYALFCRIFGGEGTKYPTVKINALAAKKTVLSLENSRLKRGDSFEKDKGDENKKSVDQSETTHFSDAFDNILVNICGNKTLTRTGASRDAHIR